MPYVRRNAEGHIMALLQTAETDAQEFLAPNDTEISSFLGESAEAQLFSKLDDELIRAIEDVIDTLINKNLLRLTDLPLAAQKKLLSRKQLRQQISEHRLNNLIDTDKGLL